MQVSRVNLQTTNNHQKINGQKQNHSQPAFGTFSKKLGYELALRLPEAAKAGLESLQVFAEQTRLIEKHPLTITLRRGMIRISKPKTNSFRTVGNWKNPTIMDTITADLGEYWQTVFDNEQAFFYGALKNRPKDRVPDLHAHSRILPTGNGH